MRNSRIQFQQTNTFILEYILEFTLNSSATQLSEAFEEWGPARPDPREVDSPPPEYSLQCDYCGGMGASDTLGGSGPTLCESCEESL